MAHRANGPMAAGWGKGGAYVALTDLHPSVEHEPAVGEDEGEEVDGRHVIEAVRLGPRDEQACHGRDPNVRDPHLRPGNEAGGREQWVDVGRGRGRAGQGAEWCQVRGHARFVVRRIGRDWQRRFPICAKHSTRLR